MKNLLMCGKSELESIVLRPSFTFSLSHQNKKSGSISGTKHLSFSACITLWNMMMWMMAAFFAMKFFLWLFRMNEERKIRKKLRRKKKKMSKS